MGWGDGVFAEFTTNLSQVDWLDTFVTWGGWALGGVSAVIAALQYRLAKKADARAVRLENMTLEQWEAAKARADSVIVPATGAQIAAVTGAPKEVLAPADSPSQTLVKVLVGFVVLVFLAGAILFAARHDWRSSGKAPPQHQKLGSPPNMDAMPAMKERRPDGGRDADDEADKHLKAFEEP